MSTPSDPVEEAVARILEQLELGGPEVVLDHLDPQQRAQVREIVQLLELTEGLPVDTARPGEESPDQLTRRTARALMQSGTSEQDRAVLEELDRWLPAGVLVDVDDTPAGGILPGLQIASSWVIGTPGGRVRVWLVDTPNAGTLERDPSHLEQMDRAFRLLPDTAAVCLVGQDRSCLLLEPQDCGPGIEVPEGGVASRRYRRPVQPLGQALAVFTRELIPVWEALPRFDPPAPRALDVSALAHRSAQDAVDLQRAAGSRARHPKKEVLTALGEAEADSLGRLTAAIYEGRLGPEDVATQLDRLAGPA